MLELETGTGLPMSPTPNACVMTVATTKAKMAAQTQNRRNLKIRSVCRSSQATMTLNPLAFPKGVKYLCELCQKPAYMQCTQCRVTYYW